MHILSNLSLGVRVTATHFASEEAAFISVQQRLIRLMFVSIVVMVIAANRITVLA